MQSDPKNLLREHSIRKGQLNSRRLFLKNCGLSLGSLAMGGLIGCQPNNSIARVSDSLSANFNPLNPKSPHFAAKAKSVIY